MSQVTVKTDIPQTVNYQSCTVQVGTTTTLESNQNATVSNSGTVYNAVLNFGIPRGKTAYEQAVEGGYTGTEAEFRDYMANSANFATASHTWAEGTDEEVEALGGTHSSKEWAQEAEQVVSGKQDISNLVTSVSEDSTDSQYPSAKLLYDQLSLKDNQLSLKADTDLSNLTQKSTFNVLKPQNTLMYVNSAGVIATIGGRSFYKANADGGYAAIYQTDANYIQPVIVAETEAGAMAYDDVDTTPRYIGTFSWNGKTWYYSASGYAMPSSSDIVSSLLTLKGTYSGPGGGALNAAQSLLDLQFSTPKNTLPVETYRNGASWYRIWSDGWCEQGGVFASGSDATQTLTLLVPYANTNYQVWYCGCGTNTNTGGASWVNQIFYPETNSTAIYRRVNYTRWWRSAGYTI